MNRRKFLSSAGLILGAPAIVRAESLMKIWVPRGPTWIGVDWAEGRGIACQYSIKIDSSGRIAGFGLSHEDFETAHKIIRETAAIYEAFRIKDKRLLGGQNEQR